MTIAIGFRCTDGVILCADTLETFDGTKRHVPKLVVKERDDSNQEPLVLAVAGAGDGPFIDRIITDVWKAIETCTDLDDACLAADDEILRVYDRYARSFYVPDAQLIYAIRSAGSGSRLFHAAGQIVNEVAKRSIGCGHILSDYLIGKLQPGEDNIGYMMQIAAYVLKETKQYVDGCGGDSQIAVIPDSGISHLLIPQEEIVKREKMYTDNEFFIDSFKHVVANPDQSIDHVDYMLKLLRAALIRKEELRVKGAW